MDAPLGIPNVGINGGGRLIVSGGVDNGAVVPPSSLGPDDVVVEIVLPSGHGELLSLANAAKLRDQLTEALTEPSIVV